MRFSAVSILLIGCIVCCGFDRALGGLFGGGAPALPAANPLAAPASPLGAANPVGGNAGNTLAAAGAANQLMSAMPACQCPVDHSCDNVPFSEMGNKIGGGGLTQGAQKGLMGGIGKRRRRSGIGGLGNAAGALGGMSGGSNPFAGAGLMQNVPGGSTLDSSMFKGMLQGKMSDCDKNEQQQQQLGPQLAQGLASGKFNPQQMDVGKQCQDAMNTNKDKCNMMKRQCCSMMNGGISDPTKLQCSMKDILATQSQIQAKNTACDTASSIMKNPNDPNTFNNAKNGALTAGALGAAGNKLG